MEAAHFRLRQVQLSHELVITLQLRCQGRLDLQQLDQSDLLGVHVQDVVRQVAHVDCEQRESMLDDSLRDHLEVIVGGFVLDSITDLPVNHPNTKLGKFVIDAEA